MASKRRRKLAKKELLAVDQRMTARRDAFNDSLWKFGLPIGLALILILVVYFGFFYTLGPINADEWKLEEAETGEIYKSSNYYNNNKVILVEFFHSECPHCQHQTDALKEIYTNYSSNGTIDMFSIGGYKLGSNKVDTKNDIKNFKFQYTLEWPHLYDDNGELMRDYGFTSYPSMVLIKNGDIIYSEYNSLYFSKFYTLPNGKSLSCIKNKK